MSFRNTPTWLIACAAILSAIAPEPAPAAALTVTLDGSTSYTTVQEGVDAAREFA